MAKQILVSCKANVGYPANTGRCRNVCGEGWVTVYVYDPTFGQRLGWSPGHPENKGANISMYQVYCHSVLTIHRAVLRTVGLIFIPYFFERKRTSGYILTAQSRLILIPHLVMIKIAFWLPRYVMFLCIKPNPNPIRPTTSTDAASV